MPFNFGGPDFPVALKFARSLLFSEAILFLFAALFVVLLDVANPGAPGTSGSGTSASPLLGVIAFVAGAILVYLAVDLRNLKPLTRNLIVAAQAILFVSTLVTSLSEPISVALVTLLAAGVLYCLLVDKDAQAAFAGEAAAPSAGAASESAKAKAADEKVDEILKKAAARDAQQAAEDDSAEAEKEEV